MKFSPVREKNFKKFFNNFGLRTVDFPSPKSFNGGKLRAIGKGFLHEMIYYADEQSHNDKTHKWHTYFYLGSSTYNRYFIKLGR
jgi:hypothetical protein